MEGWISIHRKITEHPDYFAEPFTRMGAWIDLILIANHKSGYIRKRGVKVEIKRGQSGASRDYLSKRWQWSPGKVARFLAELENDGQIVQQKSNVISCITICNYDQYQQGDTANSTADGRQTVQQTGEQTGEQTDGKQYSKQDDKRYANNNDNNILSLYSDEIFEIDLVKNHLLSQQLWLDQVGIALKLKTPEKTREWVAQFFEELKAKGETHKSVKDSQEHFVNWMKLQNRKNHESSKANSKPLGRKLSGSDFDD